MALFRRKAKPPAAADGLEIESLPRHVAIIMDGNGRWAVKRLLPRSAGHRAGMEALRQVIEMSRDIGIRVVSVFALSTENHKRPAQEVSFLMSLLIEYFEKEIDDLDRKNVRIRWMGEPDRLPDEVVDTMRRAVERTRGNTGLVFNIAFNYGARRELVLAAQKAMETLAQRGLPAEALDEELLGDCLMSAGLPDPDLVIRTSGEKRLSNFMLYQNAYAEFYFTSVLWPDFSRAAYGEALMDFARRNRRMGGI